MLHKRTVLFLLALLACTSAAMGQGNRDLASLESQRALVDQFCAGCHNDKLKSGSFSWTDIDLAQPARHAERLEKVIRKVRSGMMPPAGSKRPDAATLKSFAAALETRIDQAAAQRPYVDSPDLHRMNRTEYRNSIRDLLGIDVDVTALLPPDAKTNGFDNISDTLTITPALMQGYMRAADRISRAAVGDPTAAAEMVSYRVPKVVNQMRHVEGTPLGTRGGISVMHSFPADGEYSFKLELYHYYTGEQIGGRLPAALVGQELEVSVDGERVAVFTIDPGMQETTSNLVTPPIRITAGQKRLSAAFISKFDGPVQDQYRLVEHTLMDVTIANNPQMTALPHLQSLYVTGPFNPSGVSDSPSRSKIFTCRPKASGEEVACATRILSRLASQAFRRPITAEDLEGLMGLYSDTRKEADFDSGIRMAIQSIIAKPEFVFRFERVPSGAAPGKAYRISDLELASRLSYFLWSSVPDEQLVTVASQGKLKDPAVLEREVKRMLLDPKSQALSTNFAGQWLRLQGIQDFLPEPTTFPDFTKNLAQSMRREVELLFESIVREDRNIVDLLTADYTFVDEVLAKHYGIPNVLGSRFRRVTLTDPNRFGLLGKGGVLTMTSLANRTSPVARGKYVLEVLMGTPPPNPPPVVPKLKESVDNEKVLTVRERMEQHRASAACSGCHKIMDPIGMAMENFDAVGVWRASDGGLPIDASGEMFEGSKLNGPVSVRQAVLNHSESFVGSFSENLLMYALGRVLDYQDMTAVRAIARDAAKNGNRFSAFVLNVVKNPAFQMRTVSSQTEQAADPR